MALPTEKPSFGVLDGVKVVYAAVEEAVPRACDLMADWGADVVWLENTGAGDTVRDTKWVKQADHPQARRRRRYLHRGVEGRHVGAQGHHR